MAAPKFPQSRTVDRATVSTANSNRDGTGTIVTVSTGTSGGNKEIEQIRITATTTVTQGMLRFYTHDGTTYDLIDELPIPAWTPSSTVPTLVLTWVPKGKPVPLPTTSDTLRCSTEKGETFRLRAEGRVYN